MRRLLLKLKAYLQSELIGLDVDDNEPDEPRELNMSRLPEAIGNRQIPSDAIAEILELYPRRSIIAYGSRVRGSSDSSSDLDIIVIDNDRSGAPSQKSHIILGMKADVTIASVTQLLGGIKGGTRNNNNWFLRALNEGIVLRDPSKHARRLKAVANQVWKGGPPPLRPGQLKTLRDSLLRLFESAEKLSARSSLSPQAARLARMRSDQLVSQSIYFYYCVRSRWTSSFHTLVNNAESAFPALYALWKQYATTSDQFAALDIARKIVDAVFKGTALEQTVVEPVPRKNSVHNPVVRQNSIRA
jgi:hypothetical protein